MLAAVVLAVLACSLGARVVRAGDAFVGCVDNSWSSGTVVPIQDATDPDDCAVWSHTPGSAASGLTRRRRALPARTLCPSQYTACNVPGTNGTAYECIDVMSELESCGGCIEGEYDNPTKPRGKE
ncbi:hypothetical protein EHS25_009999 [Saitozyma podzolica]|uniref:Secreted protein n=1 Tax=Saitozyma podzolica TaxID=1890683 RepID=A0A427YIB2_9TREE|nr:hypothetical protein EHS25_009999 [Saitozyma podzolica]